jgi:hypothetical protein
MRLTFSYFWAAVKMGVDPAVVVNFGVVENKAYQPYQPVVVLYRSGHQIGDILGTCGRAVPRRRTEVLGDARSDNGSRCF